MDAREINQFLFNLDLVVEFQKIEYRVVSLLDNDLALVVNKEEIENEEFPLNTVIIPYKQ